MTRRFATPEAFRQALEQHLRAAANSGADFARRRQLLVFDRFLARVVTVFGERAILKGGLALEVRLAHARTTRDVDLNLTGSPTGLLEQLQEAGRLDLGDALSFEVLADAEHPGFANQGNRDAGQRFRATCKLAGKVYGNPFGVDIASGDPIVGKPDVVRADDVLGFAGIAPPTLRLYPVVTHIAEKLHAYTLPRLTPNSRVKDLPDIALLAGAGPIAGKDLRRACEVTFAFRASHELPAALPDPPPSWQAPYARIVADDELEWPTLAELTNALRTFLDPVLAGERVGTWQPSRWAWRARRRPRS